MILAFVCYIHSVHAKAAQTEIKSKAKEKKKTKKT